MILWNLNPGEGVCNGSQGIVTRMSNRVLEVQLLTGDHAGKITFIPRMSIVPSSTQVPFEFCRRQFLVKVCFAMSINKSQGQSAKHVGLDLRNVVFTHGQLYVAVSQVMSVQNIKAIWDSKLDGPVTKNIVYPEVIIDSVCRSSRVRFLALKIGNQQLKPVWTGILKKQLKMIENG